MKWEKVSDTFSEVIIDKIIKETPRPKKHFAKVKNTGRARISENIHEMFIQIQLRIAILMQVRAFLFSIKHKKRAEIIVGNIIAIEISFS